MRKILAIVPLLLMMSCSSCETTEQDVKTATVDTFKCALKYPVDVITQTSALVQKLKGADGFVTNLIAWAEGAKDTKFAMCVMTQVVADIHKSQPANPNTAQAMLQTSDELTTAVDDFRRKHFGKTSFEVPQ